VGVFSLYRRRARIRKKAPDIGSGRLMVEGDRLSPECRSKKSREEGNFKDRFLGGGQKA